MAFWNVEALTCVKSPTSDRTWSDNVFISGGNPHLTSRYCGVVLDPTTISKMVSEPPPRSVGPPAIRFPLSAFGITASLVYQVSVI
ncbi:hypothetical protein MtrunA17_Chr7g0243841 [Medicago truncatula]|uniref:Uncharacterized protein n=1 Tax=Medicago truncatula TaxID=3880 RepID=A0A072UBL4_MEDTR|nr:hypothetical protein MTR_7g070905 [Medicago truncatula]RHN46589.1 hypothetical protein MtrunA17_Chr7g0243841 [Medicago truncatula]